MSQSLPYNMLPRFDLKFRLDSKTSHLIQPCISSKSSRFLNISSHVNAFILLDCIFAIVIASFTFLSLAYLQEEIVHESKQEIYLYEEASKDLISAFKQNNPSKISIQTSNNKSYTFLLFKGESNNKQERNTVSLHRLILHP